MRVALLTDDKLVRDGATAMPADSWDASPRRLLRKLLRRCGYRLVRDGVTTMPSDSWDAPPRYLLNKLLRRCGQLDCVTLLGPDDGNMPRLADVIHNIDGIIVHTDTSVRPHWVTEVISQAPPGIPILNCSVTDIRKRSLSDVLSRMGLDTLEVDPDQRGNPLVFVKSTYNSGDAPGILYKKCPLKDVPALLASRPDLVVQRFIQDRLARAGTYARMRRFVCVAGAVTQLEYFGTEDVIKRQTSLAQYSRDISVIAQDFELLARQDLGALGFHYRDFEFELPGFMEILGSFRKAFGLDFGSIDTIAVRDEGYYILDVNPTPWERGLPEALERLLADALERYFTGGGR